MYVSVCEAGCDAFSMLYSLRERVWFSMLHGRVCGVTWWSRAQCSFRWLGCVLDVRSFWGEVGGWGFSTRGPLLVRLWILDVGGGAD